MAEKKGKSGKYPGMTKKVKECIKKNRIQKIIIPWTADDEAAAFLKRALENSPRKEMDRRIVPLLVQGMIIFWILFFLMHSLTFFVIPRIFSTFSFLFSHFTGISWTMPFVIFSASASVVQIMSFRWMRRFIRTC